MNKRNYTKKIRSETRKST